MQKARHVLQTASIRGLPGDADTDGCVLVVHAGPQCLELVRGGPVRGIIRAIDLAWRLA